MVVNTFFKELFEDSLGLDVLGLEYFYPTLIELISRRTLSTFSEYIFHNYDYYFDYEGPEYISEDKYQPGREYWINDPFLDRFNIQVYGIKSVEPIFQDKDEDDFYVAGFNGAGYSISDILMGSEVNYQRSMLSAATGRITRVELTGNRSFRVYNTGAINNMRAKLLLRYPTLASIPNDMKEKFLELASYDVKIKLWNELKFMEDLATPGGSINLKIGDYEGAYNDRKDFLNELRTKTFSDRVGESYFTIF